jgi:hypothetical protein
MSRSIASFCQTFPVLINRTSDVRLESGGQEDAVLLALSALVAS